MLQAEGGQTVFQTREERDSSELAGSSGGYGFSARIPLRDIAPGLYVLRVEAQSRVAERLSVSRETIVNVLPGSDHRVHSQASGRRRTCRRARRTSASAPAAPAQRRTWRTGRTCAPALRTRRTCRTRRT